ncbi:MAG: dihydroneopterin aldolase [Holosporaceae bacterium]|nr:dihydroneopterin aldolase [Holosporaceae bacterium]
MVRQLNMRYETDIILGNEDFEKREKRRIIVDICLRFPKKNRACSSDNLGDTICYAQLSNFINDKLQNSDFNLIERVADFLYEEITFYLNDKTILKRIKVAKPEPPVNNLESASFIYSDW